MAHTEAALRDAVTLAAWAVGVVGLALQLLACSAELLRRHRPAAGLVRIADRLVPAVGRRSAVAMFAAVAALVAVASPRAVSPSATLSGVAGPEAGGPGTLRGWLTGPDAATSKPTPPSSAATDRRDRETTPTTPLAAVEPVAPPRPRPTAMPAARSTEMPEPAPAASATPPAPRTYTVTPGDCLWSIARRQLGPRASERAVDRGWRAIYAANAAGIGADPNLIHPGLVLVLPPLDPTS